MATRWPQKAHWASERCLTENEGGTLAPRNTGSLNNACLKRASKTSHIKAWQSEQWAQRQLLKSLLEELDQRFPLLIFLSRGGAGSPHRVCWQSSHCPHCFSAPQGQAREKARRTAPLWEPPGEGLSHIWANWATEGNAHELPCLCSSLWKYWQPATSQERVGAEWHQDEHAIPSESRGFLPERRKLEARGPILHVNLWSLERGFFFKLTGP